MDKVYQGAGTMTFLQGAANSAVNCGPGPAVFDIVQGSTGTLTVSDFAVGKDSLHIIAGSGISLRTEQVVSGSVQLVFSNNTKVTLLGISDSSISHLFS